LHINLSEFLSGEPCQQGSGSQYSHSHSHSHFSRHIRSASYWFIFWRGWWILQYVKYQCTTCFVRVLNLLSSYFISFINCYSKIFF